MDDWFDEDLTISTVADNCMDEIHKLLKVSDLKGTMDMVTTAITACKADRKWKADLSKEVHSRLTSAINVLMVNAKSY